MRDPYYSEYAECALISLCSYLPRGLSLEKKSNFVKFDQIFVKKILTSRIYIWCIKIFL
jgi:hypothetical protein